MLFSNGRITPLVLEVLTQGERRLLALTVAVRRKLQLSPYKGDLSAAVKATLRKLVASGEVHDRDGVFAVRKTPVERKSVRV